MIISLDYDLTYTADPTLWNNFLRNCMLRGHTVYIVTARPDDCPIDKEPLVDKVFYTAGESKKPYMEKQGIDVNIWIDDSPNMITDANPWTKEQWNEWRVAHGFKPYE